MNLDPKIAETIVENLKEIVRHEINLFDTTGTIVASTDRTRVGTNHDGARLAVRTKKSVPIDSEHEFRGAKSGINVPVMFDDSVVAVIGITGQRAEVEPYGNIIKKMTEILIRENWDLVTQYDQRTRTAHLVSMLKMKHHDVELAAYYASSLRIDLNVPRTVVVGRIQLPEGEIPELGMLYSMAHARFQQLRSSFFSFADMEACLIVGESDMRALPQVLEGMRQDARRILGKPLLFGVGKQAAGSASYWVSYKEATRALCWAEYAGEDGVCYFDQMDAGLVVSSVPAEEADQLVSRVFGGLSDADVDAFQQVFDAYTRHNGSISHCAEELFLHKNTLQNRLNKIAEKTGYNPRDLADYAVLSLAFRLREYRRFHAPCAS